MAGIVIPTGEGDNLYPCTFPGCTKAFANARLLKRHMSRHGDAQHCCDQCDKKFKERFEVRIHKLNKHNEGGDNQYPCTFSGCTKAFKTAKLLKTHLIRHSDARPHCCDECDKTFKTRFELANHKLHRHNDEGNNQYPCTFPGCTQAFKTAKLLKNHSVRHSDVRPYCCPVQNCGKTFKRARELKDHELRHSDESKGNLNDHDNERTYKCRYEGCKADFKTSSDRAHHEARMHRDVRPHKCEYPDCNAVFIKPSQLKTHSVIHTGERPYVCREEGCGASFSFSSSLSYHHKAYHTAEGQATRKKQEQRIHDALTAAGIEFEREVLVHFGPIGQATTRYARVDFVIKMADREILLEVDENQHRFGYGSAGCDVVRMACIIEALSARPDEEEALLPKLFIRYNPHGYKVDGATNRKPKRDREEALIAFLNDLPVAEEDTPPLEVQYMFYDTENGKPTVITDPDYNTHFAECCRPAII